MRENFSRNFKLLMILAWVNVGLYGMAAILFANNYGTERAFRIYTGYDIITRGWYEDCLIRPGMLWVSLIVALLLTRLRKNLD